MRVLRHNADLSSATGPSVDRPRCYIPKEPYVELTGLVKDWRAKGDPSQLLSEGRSIEDECDSHHIILVEHNGIAQGYLSYRLVGNGRLSDLADQEDGLDISNYLDRNKVGIQAEDLGDLPVLGGKHSYQRVVFINKIETLTKGMGYGGMLLHGLHRGVAPDLIIAHAIDSNAESFFESNGFECVGVQN